MTICRPPAEFACSNDTLNRIYRNIVWGTRGNYRSMPTDCPQRDERQGWLGDRSEECKGEAYLFNIAPLYAKWRQDMADAQKPNGSLPDVAPAYWPIYSDNVTWPSSAIIIPSALDRHFGDRRCASTSYQSAKLWIEHMLGFATNHIISRDNYGDWCVPPEDPHLIHSKDPARQTDKALLATSYFYHDLRLMERYARQLGNDADAERWSRGWRTDSRRRSTSNSSTANTATTTTAHKLPACCRWLSAWCPKKCARVFSPISWTRSTTKRTDTSAPA